MVYLEAAVGAKMKIILNIPAPLLREARHAAARRGITLQALVEQGLRKVVAARTANVRGSAFRLRKASFKGRGLRPELHEASWDEILALAYAPLADKRRS
jgi:hypothetical protein